MVHRSIEVGPLEMQVLGILNGKKPMGVAEIQSALKESGHELAYTTVMTVLVRLFKKGFLKRKKEGRQFLYSSDSGRKTASQKLFEKVRNSLFRDQRLQPILALLDSESDLTTDELKTLQRAVDERLKRSQGRN